MTIQTRVRTIFPVVFVPADGAGWNADYPTALDTAVDTALAWWQRQLGERSFDAVPAIAVGGLQPRAAYTPDTQEKLRQELAAYYPELGGELDAGIVYAVYACLSSDPYTCPGDVIGASAVRSGDAAVLVVQSSGSLDSFACGQNPLDPLTGSRAAQTGALAHELGHCLGLPHPDDPLARSISVMWSWWDFPACGLTATEAATARRVVHMWAPAGPLEVRR
jgi:hypothetical protein